MTHRLPIRPRFGELDPYNHVNHSVYVAWFEAARCEALDSLGLALHTLAERGLQIVVVEINVKYRSPAKAGEDLVIETATTELGGVTSTWSQRLLRAADASTASTPADALAAPRPTSGWEVLCEAEVRAGVCDLAGRPSRAGAALRKDLAPLFVDPAIWRSGPNPPA